MKVSSFNQNWQVGQQIETNFYEAQPEKLTVCLPYDAGISLQRDPNVKKGSERGYFPHAIFEYSKKFHITEDYKQKHVVLRFEGAYGRAMVYVNGSYAAQQANGYTEFYVSLDKFLKYGCENEVKVVMRTVDDSRWYTGIGLYRPVQILVSGLTHFAKEGIKVTPSLTQSKKALVEVESIIHSKDICPTQTLHMECCVFDDAQNLVAKDICPVTVFRGEQTKVNQRIYISAPNIWSTQTPNLYTCKTRLINDEAIVDEDETRFGIRELAVSPEDGFCINGKTVNLRGGCIHHDNGIIGSAAIGYAERRKVEKLKEAGFNAVRMAHNPASREFLNACDEMGMLVMEEAFDVWTDPKNSLDFAYDFEQNWQETIVSMVNKDYNHPSVIMYSIGNEISETGKPFGAARGRKIAQKIKQLDKSRFIINSINGMLSVMDRMQEIMIEQAKNMEQKDINQAMTDVGDRITQVMRMPLIGTATEEAYACVDIAGYNYMHGRYEEDGKLFPNRVICGSETHPANIDRNWAMVEKLTYLIGDFTWTAWDYLGEVGIGRVVYNSTNSNAQIDHKGAYPWLTAWCGDFDITGKRRPVSYYREIVFGLRKKPYIAVYRPEHYSDDATLLQWSWSDTVESWSFDGYENKPILVEVYSKAQEIELVLNGITQGRKQIAEHDRFKAKFDIKYTKGELVAIAYDNNVETGRCVLHSAAGTKKLCANVERSAINVAEDELNYISVSMQDENGNTYFDSETKINVTVSNNAKLIAVGSGKPDNTESFFENCHTLFDGYAQAVVRPLEKGEVTITVAADNYETISVTYNQI